jgi:hypothetical protein
MWAYLLFVVVYSTEYKGHLISYVAEFELNFKSGKLPYRIVIVPQYKI